MLLTMITGNQCNYYYLGSRGKPGESRKNAAALVQTAALRDYGTMTLVVFEGPLSIPELSTLLTMYT